MNDVTRIVCVVLAAVGATWPVAGRAAPDYDRDIAPILRTYCAGCHNDREAEAGFSVEWFATLRKGGDESGDPIVPGDPQASVMIRRIKSTAADQMPPADEPQVPAADRATLEAWIAAGAAGPAADVSILEKLVVPALPASRAPRPVTALSVSPDGGRLAVARGRTVEIVPLRDGRPAERPLRSITDLRGPVTAVHFAPDGKRIVVASGVTGLNGVAEIRDAATGAVERSFGGHRDLVYDAELSPDGAMLATVGYDRSVKLWNVADGALLRSIDVHTGAVFDVAWHPSGKLLGSASADETVKLWRARDGLRLDTLNQPEAEVAAVAFTPDGRHVVAAGRDKRIHAWSLVSVDEPAINPAVQSRFAHETPIVALAVSADGTQLVSAAEDRTVKAWSLPGLEPLAPLPRAGDVVAAIVPVGDGFLLGSMNGGIDRVAVPRAASGTTPVAVAPPQVAKPVPLATEPARDVAEVEPNDAADTAQTVTAPAAVRGVIGRPGDADCVRFAARAGMPLVVEVVAAMGTPASRLDSRVEILHADGRPVEQVVLQAVRDSWFTFRGKTSDQTNDFRLHNQDQLELDQYLYANGEVTRLWLYPRGPDSGCEVYPGSGKRHTFFHTTPIAHALGEPAWIVEPLPAGARPTPNGLPLFRMFFENDDEPMRRLGTDSQVMFVPPADGEYVARVSDSRGFGAETNFHYTLRIRPPQPSFDVTVGGRDPQVSPGSGRELAFTATRGEGFEGPIRIDVEGLPPGFTFHGPIEIEAGQRQAQGVLRAAADAAAPDEAADKKVTVRAVATVAGREVVRDLGTLGDIRLAAAPKVTVEILPGADRGVVREVPGEPIEFTIRPRQTITARVKVARHDLKGPVALGKEGAGRNLPHGVFVDNLGLNGLLLTDRDTEREFFITAAPKAAAGRRLFHLVTEADGGQASVPVWLNVLPARK